MKRQQVMDDLQVARMSILEALEGLSLPTGSVCTHCGMVHYKDGQRQLYRMRTDLEAFADKLERKIKTISHWETE